MKIYFVNEIYFYIIYFLSSSKVDFNSFFNSKTSQKCIKIKEVKKERLRLKRRFNDEEDAGVDVYILWLIKYFITFNVYTARVATPFFFLV